MLGQSAGRSVSNSPRRTARRRFEEAERAANTPLLDDPNYWEDEKLPPKSRMSTIVLDVAGALLWAGIMVWCLVMFSIGGWIGRGGAGLAVALNVGLYFQVVNLRRKLNP